MIDIRQGDCLDLLRALLDGSVDAVVTDLPYALAFRSGPHRNGKGKGTRRLDYSDLGSAEEGIAGWKHSLTRVKNGGFAFAFTGSDLFGEALLAARERGLTAKPYAWVKKCPAPAPPGTMLASAFELAVFAYGPGAFVGSDDPRRTNVAVEDSYRHGQPGKVNHPTQKPLRLLRRLIRMFTRPGDTILDPFGGSGTTAVACALEGRNCILMEREPAYVEIARRRVAEAEASAGLFAEIA